MVSKESIHRIPNTDKTALNVFLFSHNKSLMSLFFIEPTSLSPIPYNQFPASQLPVAAADRDIPNMALRFKRLLPYNAFSLTICARFLNTRGKVVKITIDVIIPAVKSAIPSEK